MPPVVEPVLSSPPVVVVTSVVVAPVESVSSVVPPGPTDVIVPLAEVALVTGPAVAVVPVPVLVSASPVPPPSSAHAPRKHTTATHRTSCTYGS
jgi:hypothetical protein